MPIFKAEEKYDGILSIFVDMETNEVRAEKLFSV